MNETVCEFNFAIYYSLHDFGFPSLEHFMLIVKGNHLGNDI